MRRHRARPAAAGLLLGLALGITAAAHAQGPPAVPASEVRGGRDLFEVACSSCHGLTAAGTEDGPSLVGVGAASADFYLSTGRMPLDDPRAQPSRKPPAYSEVQVRQLVAYVASLGPGPSVPASPASAQAPTGTGARLYAARCASCHGPAGAGGAHGPDRYAPALYEATPLQVAQAVRIGPGTMPALGPDELSDSELAAVVRHVTYLQAPAMGGAVGLGRAPAVPAAVLAAVAAVGLVVLARRAETVRG